jgi:hypothetical protein
VATTKVEEPVSGSTENAFSSGAYGASFYLLVGFMLIEYGRPQSFVAAISSLHPGWIFHSLLMLVLIARRGFRLRLVETKFFFVILILMVLHILLARNTYWAFHVWKSSFLYFIVYLYMVSVLDSVSKINRFVQVWIVILVICAAVGIKNGGRVPNSAFMEDENDFALVLCMGISYAFFLFQSSDTWKGRLFNAVACMIFVSAVVASFSRGGFLGLISTTLYCWYRSKRRLQGIMVIFMVVTVMFFAAPQKYWERMRTIKEDNIERGSGEERWYAWMLATKMFRDQPVIGVGQGNYAFRVIDYEDYEALHGTSRAGRVAHSLYFTLISELGIVGVLCFFGMLSCFYRNGRGILQQRCRDSILLDSESFKQVEYFDLNSQQRSTLKFVALGTEGALVGYLVAGTFLSVLYYPHFWLLLAVNVACKNTCRKMWSKPEGVLS